MSMVKDMFFSVRTSLWLIGAQLALMLAGAVQMPAMPQYEGMNDGALLLWMREMPIAVTWWLWASIVVLGMLTVNTLCCSYESVMRKRQGKNLVLVLAPQVVHVGFLFMLLGHLVSALGAAHWKGVIREGQGVGLADGSMLVIERVDVAMSEMGYAEDFAASVRFERDGAIIKSKDIAPNQPAFMGGTGAYIKDARPGMALIEISREPGTPWAFIGAALFTLGTIALFAAKIARDR